jgi:GT2 family glycosyltransferase
MSRLSPAVQYHPHLGAPDPAIPISVVILNYNGARWLKRCLDSLKAQTIFRELEIILADNLSTDGSDQLAERLVAGWSNARFVQHGENLGYCEGNNRAALQATGEFLLFLNNDTWLEPNCLEVLLRETRRANAQCATPLVLNYDDSSFQSLGAQGLDIFGLTSTRTPFSDTREVFMPEGCSYLVHRQVFLKLGGFDPVLFMFSDELDLSWRLWNAGYKAVGVPSSRLHHRGAANVNPKGDGQVLELRTSDTKRFFANRNGLLVVWKNAEHLLLLMLPLQVALLLLEAIAAFALVRRWAFVRRSYLDAIRDCWRLREHISRERRRLGPLRRRSDVWMLRFLRWRPNRWDEIVRAIRFGPPNVTPQ